MAGIAKAAGKFGKTILDGVVDGSVRIAKTPKSQKMWNGKLLKDLSEEEKITRRRELNAEAQRRFRANLDEKRAAEIRKQDADRARNKRHNFTPEEREEYNAYHRENWRKNFENMTPEERAARNEKKRIYDERRFERETPEQKALRLQKQNERRILARAQKKALIESAAYPETTNPEVSYGVSFLPGQQPVGNGYYLSNRRGNNVYGRKLQQLGNVAGMVRGRDGERAASIMNEVTNASGLDEQGFKKFLDDCAKRTGSREGCLDEFYGGGFRNFAPTAEQISQDPIYFANHPSNVVSSYARSLANGDNAYNAPREMKYLNDEALLKMYQDSGNVDAFNEWFSRNKKDLDKNANLMAFSKFYRSDSDLAKELQRQGLSDMYSAARDVLRTADLSKASPKTYVNNRYKWDVDTFFRGEFGGGKKEFERKVREAEKKGVKNSSLDLDNTFNRSVIGRRNLERRMSPVIMNDGSEMDMYEHYFVPSAQEAFRNDERDREVKSLLYGPVKEAFTDNNFKQHKNIFNELVEAYNNGEGFQEVSDKLGMSRQNLYNRIKAAKERLKEKGIIGSDY